MKQSLVQTKQQEMDIAVAFIISMGVLLALGGLPPVFGFFVSGEWKWVQIVFPFGVFLAACGFALKRRHRHAWTASVVICFVGLAWFPWGTILCGMLLWRLWKVRPTYYRSLKMLPAEQVDAGSPPSSDS